MEKDNSSSAYQALCNLAIKQSYITFDDILSVAEQMSLSIDVVDWLTDSLITHGYLVLDEKPDSVVDEADSDDYEDFAQIDYNIIFNKIIKLDPSLKSFIEEVSKIKPSQRGEMDRLKYLAVEGNTYARERMIEMHIRAALRIALQRAEQYDLDISETISDALFGLTLAIDKYDPDTNDKFSGYSFFWILQTLGRNHPTKRPLVYYPVHKKEEFIKCYPFLKEEGCSDCPRLASCMRVKEKVADYLNVQYSTAIDDIILQATPIETLQSEMFNLDTLSAFNNEPGYLTIKSPDEVMSSEGLSDSIRHVLSMLTERERKVIQLRFGFIDGKQRTLEEAGKEFGVTRERIRQIEAKALRKLKHPTKSKYLKDYVKQFVVATHSTDTNNTTTETKGIKEPVYTLTEENEPEEKIVSVDTLLPKKEFMHFYSVDEDEEEYSEINQDGATVENKEVDKNEEEVTIKKWSAKEHANIEVQISCEDALSKIISLLNSYPDGLKARSIAGLLRMNKKDVNRILYSNTTLFVAKDYIWKNRRKKQ
ncbi:MAG: sigma-70 family RNA polymerase sigma factor [Methanobrevibacter sp.]|nr:sigma-70 family RNA polymerase sigma factor [Clostridia bacterium]MBQ6628649.1 sigma-70 family RNA polymerase sigma factor [Methanobrevibacter sp.]